jgi:hypothetical protein
MKSLAFLLGVFVCIFSLMHNPVYLRKDKLILPPFQIVGHFSFVINQTSKILNKFIEKCTNIYNIKSVSLNSP